jgi:tetratricopeptide (TPR) repeat protein
MHQNSLTNKILFFTLLFITFLSPIFFIPGSLVSTQFGVSILFSFSVILSFLIYSVLTLTRGSIDLPKNLKYVLGVTALVPVVYVLSGLSHGFSRMSFFGYIFDTGTVGFIVLGFIYFFLVSVLFVDKKRIFYSYMAIVLSSIIFAVFLLVRIILGPEVLSFGIFNTITSTMIGSFNNVGIFFGIGLLLTLFTYEMANVSRIMRVILSIAIAISLFFLSIVNFSILWIILAICSFLFILYSFFNHPHHHLGHNASFFSKIPKLTLIVFIISMVFVVWSSSVGMYLPKKLEISNSEIQPTLSATMEIARNTLAREPLFGSGPNTFTSEWLMWKPNEVVSTVFLNTDFSNGVGFIPTFVVTTGIVGILSWLVFLGFYLYLGFKSIFSNLEDHFVKYLLVSSFFVSLYLWIVNFVYVPSTSIFIMTLFFTAIFFSSIYLSGIIKFENKEFSTNPRSGFLVSLVLISIMVGSGFIGYGLFKNSVSVWYFQKSFYELNSLNNAELSEKYVKQAIEAVPMDVYYRALSELGIIKMNIIASTDPKNTKTEDLQKQFGDALSMAVTAGISAKDADPKNYLNWIALGRVYESVAIPDLKIQGAYDSAEFAYLEALKRNPKNPGILMLLSRMAGVQNNLVSARDYVKQAIALKSNYVDAHFLLSQIEVADKNIKSAIESATSASIIDPTNAGVLFQLGLLKYNNKDYFGAMEALQKAVKIYPDYANAKYFIALSYDATGQPEKALKEFEDVQKTNPDNQNLLRIIDNLRNNKKALDGFEEANPEKAENLPVNNS